MVWSFLLEPLISCSYFKMYGPYGGFLYVEWNLGNFRPFFLPLTLLSNFVSYFWSGPVLPMTRSIQLDTHLFSFQFFDNTKKSLFNSLRFEKKSKESLPSLSLSLSIQGSFGVSTSQEPLMPFLVHGSIS